MKKFCLINVDYIVDFEPIVEGEPTYNKSDRISAYLYCNPKNEKQIRKNEWTIMEALRKKVSFDYKVPDTYFYIRDVRYEVVGANIIGYMYSTENHFIDLTAPMPYNEN